MGKIVDLWQHRFKGMKGIRQECLVVDPKVGVHGNRRHAIRRMPGDLGAWAKKGNFFVGMNTARMAAERPRYQANGQPDPSFLAELAERIEVSGPLEVQDTRAVYNLTDTEGDCVSFLNLASVRALSAFMGKKVDPRRFRMDAWLDDLDPFEELTWVDQFPGTRIITVGPSCLEFRVDDATERCLAVEANPDTGERDLPILQALNDLMGQRGYRSPHRGTAVVMGILAAPLRSGALLRYDTVRLA